MPENDNAYAQSVWQEFGCRRLREYIQLFFMTDVCLLADVVKHFRATCYEAYELDLAYLVSAHRLALNAMFKKTKKEVKLLRDLKMY